MKFQLIAFVTVVGVGFCTVSEAQTQVPQDGRALDANPQVGSGGYNGVVDPLRSYNRRYPLGTNLGGGYFGNRYPDLRLPNRFEEERFFKRDLQFDYQASRGWDLYDSRLRHLRRPLTVPREQRSVVVRDQRRDYRLPSGRIDTRIKPQRVEARSITRSVSQPIGARQIDSPGTRIHRDFVSLISIHPRSQLAQRVLRLHPKKLKEVMLGYEQKRIEKDRPFDADQQTKFDSLVEELETLLEE